MSQRSFFHTKKPVLLIIMALWLFANAASDANNLPVKSPTFRIQKNEMLSSRFGWVLDYLKIGQTQRKNIRFEQIWFNADSTTVAATLSSQNNWYRRIILNVEKKKVLYPSPGKVPKQTDSHYPIVSACYDSVRNLWNILSGYRSFEIESIDGTTGKVIRHDANVDSLVFSYSQPETIMPLLCDSLSGLARQVTNGKP